MNFRNLVEKVIKRTKEPRVVFLSLILDVDSVSAAAWTTKNKATPTIIKTITRPVKEDSWEERTTVTDNVLSILDEAVSPDELREVVLGLPSPYVTSDGDIDPESRKEIKKLTHALELKPIGFVPIHQAIIHTMKRDEGVPPTVILLGVGSKITVTLYKVGVRIGQTVVSDGDQAAASVEGALKSFAGQEILPSRMLLYGANHEELASIQARLLRHPWQTRANFLHFPKIEVLPTDYAVGAVSVAGATELSHDMGVDEETKEESESLTPAPTKEKRDEVRDQSTEAESGSDEQESLREQETEPEEESNVVMVEPQDLGFAQKDILEKEVTVKNREVEEELEERKGEVQTESKSRLGKNVFGTLPRFLIKFPTKLPKKGLIGLAGGLVLLLALFWLGWWMIPHAGVTLLVLPEAVSAIETVTIEPTATVVESEKKIVPGRKQEQSVSGEKIASVTGKKKVGDPAKGTVTIFNKSTSSRSLKKGSVINSGGLSFTLDEDVQVASASENLVSGTVTFGKGNTNVTASTIGAQSNLPAGSEFSFKDIVSSIAIARNDKAFTGGTSRDVTVVSRQDYDGLVKTLTNELIQKAKAQLASSVSANEKLIDETVQTEVTQKSFTEEIDQESQELHGSLTITVSSISYSDEDIKTLFASRVSSSVPSGYTLNSESLSVTVSKTEVKKDGTILVAAGLTGSALPTVDIVSLQESIAGKSVEEAQEILKRTTGVGGVEFSFTYSFGGHQMPANKNNIAITTKAL